MKSIARPSFWRMLNALPRGIQRQALVKYRLWLLDPGHPSLQFKQVKTTLPPLYSVRINRDYRAAGVLKGDTVTWLWIGTHAEYDRFLS